MINRISGVDNCCLQQLCQSQSSGLSATRTFSKIDRNNDGLINKDEFATYQSSMAAQFKNSVLGSQADSTSMFLALLQGIGLTNAGNGTLPTAASNSTASINSGTLTAQAFNKIDTNRDGLISKDEMTIFFMNLSPIMNLNAATGNKLTATI